MPVGHGEGDPVSLSDALVDFYEGRFNDTEWDPLEDLSGARKLLYEVYRTCAQTHARNRFIESMMQQSELAKGRSMILDIGCGGGSRVMAKQGQVVGVDLSIKGLRNALTVGGYWSGVVADVASLPLADSSFDYIVSRDLIGHLPEYVKPRIFDEMQRVCRPGGRLIHAIEVESNNPLMRWARRHAQLYREHFILQDGHVGLESPTATSDGFENRGLRLVEVHPLFRTGVLRLDSYLHFFDNGYRDQSVFLDRVVRLAKYAERHRVFRGAWSFMAGVVDRVVGRFLPFDYAQLLLICCDNSKDEHKD